MALVTALEGLGVYLGIHGELLFALLIFALVAVVFAVAQFYQWFTLTGEWAPRPSSFTTAYPMASMQAAAPKKKKRRRKRQGCRLPHPRAGAAETRTRAASATTRRAFVLGAGTCAPGRVRIILRA